MGVGGRRPRVCKPLRRKARGHPGGFFADEESDGRDAGWGSTRRRPSRRRSRDLRDAEDKRPQPLRRSGRVCRRRWGFIVGDPGWARMLALPGICRGLEALQVLQGSSTRVRLGVAAGRDRMPTERPVNELGGCKEGDLLEELVRGSSVNAGDGRRRSQPFKFWVAEIV